MANHLFDLRSFIDSVAVDYSDIDTAPESFDDEVVVISSDHDSLLEDLELLRFKLENHTQLTGTDEFAYGYESACFKVVEMIDGILRKHRDSF